MTFTEAPKLLTIGEIAKLEREPVHRVRYAIESYRIEPRQRAGIIRLFSPDDLPRIKAALGRIANRRGVAHV